MILSFRIHHLKKRPWQLEDFLNTLQLYIELLLKGGIPATPSGTATLLRISPSYQFYLR